MKNHSTENSQTKKFYDLTEEASRLQSEEATNIARHEESDDITEVSGNRKMDDADADEWVENKVETSLDDE